MPPPNNDGTWDLSGGWKLYSESFVADDAGKVSTSGYDDSRWLPAVVPGTVLTSYLAAGAIPDMFYGDHQFQVSDWFCHSDWWYRAEMELPRDYRGKRVWLGLDGINHKADIFVNGQIVGKMRGAFIRGRFDVTDKVVAGRKNCVAVLIHPMPLLVDPTVKQLDKLLWEDRFTPNTPTFVE
jgi:beta-galactosidase/beta-glucuronidase